MSSPVLCLSCVTWNGMAPEREQQADGFFREVRVVAGRLIPICSSHAEAAKVVFIPFSSGRDEYLVQRVMED